VIDLVGWRNIRICGAPGCSHFFVKTYRREFCSLRCQQRVNKQRQRFRIRAEHEAARGRPTAEQLQHDSAVAMYRPVGHAPPSQRILRAQDDNAARSRGGRTFE
jgi:CGNR zinc finger